MLEQLLARGYLAAGSDWSADTLSGVRARFQGRPGFRGADSAEGLLASGRRFDVIFVLEVVEHLYDDWLDSLLETVRALAKPGTRIIFTTPNEEDLDASMILSPCCERLFHRYQHVRSWSRQTLSAYLEARGFRVDEAFASNFNISLARPGRRLHSLKKLLKYRLRRDKKLPHLAVVCRVNPSDWPPAVT